MCIRDSHENIDIRRVVLHHGRLPFSKPFKTPKETLTYRDTVIVEVIDRKGRVGLGECTAFDTDWYLPETLGDDLRVLRAAGTSVAMGNAAPEVRAVCGCVTDTNDHDGVASFLYAHVLHGK